MKKRKFNARAMKTFTTEPKVVHKSKPVDLITQYNRMRSIAADIYNSDFFMISSKAEQKKIEASIACISATMISMIGMEAIKNSHDCLPDDSGNGTSTDKDSHDAIKNMMNIAYGETESDVVEKAAARLALNSVHGAPSHIMVMNRRILSKLGTKSPADKSDEDPFTFGNEYDEVTDNDSDDVDLSNCDVDFGNFADGPFYSDQYVHICQLYGFNTNETLKRIVKAASGYTISKLNLVAVVSDKHDIKSDDKYYPKPGDVFFVTNKENDKDPVFVLIYTKSYLELFDFDIDKVSAEIKPVELEESTKTNYIDFVNYEAYYNIGKVHLSPNTVIDLYATLTKIKDEARMHGIDTIAFVDTIKNVLDIYAEGKYTLETGSLFFVNNDGPNLIHFILVTKGGDIPGKIFARSIDPVGKPEESTKVDDIEFTNSDAYFNIGKVHMNPNTIIDLNATLDKIKDEARMRGIDTITFVDTIEYMIDISTEDKYTLKPGDVFFYKGNGGWLNFMLIIKDKDASDDRIHVLFIEPVGEVEENVSLDDIEFIGADAYYKIDKAYRNLDLVIDLDATLIKIKEKAKEKGIKTITFVDSIKEHSDIYTSGKYSLEPGSLFFIKEGYSRFVLFNETPTTFYYINPEVVFKNDDSEEDSSDSNKDGSHDVVDGEVEFEYTPYESRYINDLATSFMAKDDIEFVGADDYYKIDKSYPDSDQIIDLDATLVKIKEKAKEKGLKTIKFMDTIKEDGSHTSDTYSYELGALFFVKNAKWVRFELITRTDLTTFHDIYPVMTKKDDSEEDSSDSKEDDIDAVRDEDKETVVTSSDEASPDYVINQYADADTSELDPDIYAKVAFPIFTQPTVTGANVSFAEICNIYDFDISEMVKRIKNAAYLEEIEEVNYVDSFQTFDDIFKTEMAQRWYGYHDGSLFLVRESTKGKLDPCFVILRKQHDDSDFNSLLYRINPIMSPAKIHGIKKIDIIDTYADGDVRIANDSKNIVDIDHSYRIKEICDKRNYDYDRISSCLKGVIAIIGGGTRLTFEGTVISLNEIVLVDPVVAYNTCSVFFVRDLILSEEEPYFVIYMPITGKTKNGYNFRLYRINPIPNLNQDPNTDSQDDPNVREISQFTSIYRANLEVSEADKDAYMKVEFSLINHIANGVIDSLQNICYTWKFNFYDTIKRIRLVAYMTNLKEIKFAGTACSHEEILEKEVLYSDGSVVFVCDEEDPHFVIVEIINGSTWLNRINPVKE